MLELLILKPGRKPPALAPVAGDYGEWVAAGMRWPAGAVRIVAVDEGHPLPPPDTVAAAVVTGSAAMVTDAAGWMESTASWLRSAVAAELPVLGICFGHQLLARALGGRTAWNPAGVEVGVVEIALTEAADDDPLLSGMPSRFPACVSHRQSVLELPQGGVQLASSAMDANQVSGSAVAPGACSSTRSSRPGSCRPTSRASARSSGPRAGTGRPSFAGCAPPRRAPGCCGASPGSRSDSGDGWTGAAGSERCPGPR